MVQSYSFIFLTSFVIILLTIQPIIIYFVNNKQTYCFSLILIKEILIQIKLSDIILKTESQCIKQFRKYFQNKVLQNDLSLYNLIIFWRMSEIVPEKLRIEIQQLPENEEEKILSDQSYEEESDNPQEEIQIQEKIIKKPGRRKKVKQDIQQQSCSQNQQSSIFDDEQIVDLLPSDKMKLRQILGDVKQKIRLYKAKCFQQMRQNQQKKSYVGQKSIPICADITKFDFQKLISKQLQIANRRFDVIMMDPPWKLSTSQPSRGVAIQYSSLTDDAIGQIPVSELQTDGFLLVWVINAKFQWTVKTMEKKWGYKVVDSINWIKKTVTGKIAKGHGFYLQHAKQTCIVGVKGNPKYVGNVASDVIFAERRGQSQKPTQIYQYVQQLVPNGYYLQIFGRRNNLRSGWVTIGNEL